MAALLRIVADTNVVLAASRSPHSESPGKEIMERWRAGQLQLLYTTDILAEYAEKLLEREIPEAVAERFLRLLARHGETVDISFFHLRHYPKDGDDVIFLLCALNGGASHLVSYDTDLLELRTVYEKEMVICQPLEFLTALRASLTPPT